MWQKYHKSPFLFSTLFIYLLNAFSLGFPQKKVVQKGGRKRVWSVWMCECEFIIFFTLYENGK